MTLREIKVLNGIRNLRFADEDISNSAFRIFLLGGCGNQLFEYAAAHHYSQNKDIPVILDASTLGNFELEISDLIPSRNLSIRNNSRYHKMTNRAIHRGLFKNVLRERSLTISSIPIPGSAYYGYFQDVKIVELVLPQVVDSLKVIRKKMENELKHYFCAPQEFISLHIRGGDYLSNRNVYSELSHKYYFDALQVIDFKESDKILLFTDDLDHASKILSNLDLPLNNLEIIEKTKRYSPLETILLMSLAKSVISANSTFSWWGAMIAKSQESRIVQPTEWYVNDPEKKKRNRLSISDAIVV